jgi:hypothetical protein
MEMEAAYLAWKRFPGAAIEVVGMRKVPAKTSALNSCGIFNVFTLWNLVKVIRILLPQIGCVVSRFP